MFFGSNTRRSNTFVIKPGGYEFSRFEIYWSSFLRSCVVCTTICINSVVCTTICINIVNTSQSGDLSNVHTWMICSSVAASDVLRELWDAWCFGNKSDIVWAVVFVSPVLYPFRTKVVRLIIFKFLSSISHPVLSPRGLWWAYAPKRSSKSPKLKYETL